MIFLNVDNSVNIKTRLLNLSWLVLEIIMGGGGGGTMSQNFHLGSSSFFKLFRKLSLQNL